MDLPYSIKQSETLMQLITVYNYMNNSQDALVSVDHDVKFTIEDPTLQWKGSTFKRLQLFISPK